MARRATPKAADEPARWTLPRQADFLAHLAASCNVRASAGKVGMSEQSVYRLRMRSADFRRAFDIARDEGYVRLEMLMLERAGGSGDDGEVSEKLAMTLIAQHRARMRDEPRPAEIKRDMAEVRKKLEAKLSEMNKRMGGDG